MASTGRILLLVCALLSAVAPATGAAVLVRNLQVEYTTTPLGIDVPRPRFGWQIDATAGERGVSQSAYRVEVRDPKGSVVWDSKRIASAESVGIEYGGLALKATTRYAWTVTAWTPSGARLTATSWFETGLMDPAPGSSAWSGAKWIGGGNDDLVLYSPYLAVFDARFRVAIAPGSTRASFVYGANDSRLMDRNKNVYQLENGPGRSYVRLELDVSGVGVSPGGRARLHVYRAGYAPTDSPGQPLRTLEIPASVIDSANRNAEHLVEFHSAFGQITVSIDGSRDLQPVAVPAPAGPGGLPPVAGSVAPGAAAAVGAGQGPGGRGAPNVVNVNPMGVGWDYLPFGMLCDIGFAVEAGQAAAFRDVTVRNSRAPGNILFREDLGVEPYRGIFADALGAELSIADGRYVLAGGATPRLVVRSPSHNSMPMLRTRFTTSPKAIAAARLYVTARGIYEMFLNGTRVGDDYYNPGLTQYNVTQMYQTYDVTKLVTAGDNALGAMLGEGWWSGLLSFGAIWNHFGDRQSLLAKLVISYADGSSDTITSNDRSWKYLGQGPLIYGSLDFGEVYDAARERAVEGWTTAAYDDRAWKRAVEVPLEGTAFSGGAGGRGGAPGAGFTFDRLSLIGQVGATAGVFRTLTAQSVKEVRPGVFVYDMGQNMVGVPRITIPGGRAGAVVTLRYAEMLYPDLPESGRNVGMIMTENYRAALSQDVYRMKAGSQVVQPRFTSHGFRYVEITGLESALPLAAVEGLAISSVRRLTADYRTSSEKVNRLWSNVVWSNVGNFLTIPTDCPQRNERMGWSGDINVFSRTATYVSNADQFLARHMFAMRDVQLPSGKFTDIAPVGGGFGGVLWGSAGIVVPWETYLQYKDVGLLERHYAAMAAYVNYLETTIDPKTGLSADAMLGDWLGPQNDLLGSAFLATAYHAYDLGIMAKVAAILGKTADAARFRALHEARKAFFNATFVNADKKTLATGRSGFGGAFAPLAADDGPQFRLADTQTSYAVGIGMGLFDAGNAPHMIRNLADAVSRENVDDEGKVRPKYSLMTGFIGTAWISQALSDSGLGELAYRMLHNEQYPSWLYAVDQGATTIWERLNGYTLENGFGGNNSMNSFNHYSFGAVGQWMLAYSLGIQRDEPGFRRFTLQPEPDPTGVMTWAEGHYDSVYGRIGSAWKLDGAALTYRAAVPANTVATLHLPAPSADAVKEGGRDARRAAGVTFLKYEGGKAVYALKSGSYVFTVTR